MKHNVSITVVLRFKGLNEDLTMNYGLTVMQEKVERPMDFNFIFYSLFYIFS